MQPKVHYVTYLPETRLPPGGHEPVTTLPLAAVARLWLEPGADVRLLAGAYWPPAACVDPHSRTVTPRPLCLEGIRGTPEAPVRIGGQGKTTRIIGSNSAVPLYPELPERSDFAFFQLIDCDWIEISDMTVESCWPCFVYIENSRHISIRNITACDGIYLAFARGGQTRRVLVEGCDWTQDPTGVMWSDLDWAELHHGRYRFFNGALFGATDISGEVVVRKNTVSDAYNGVRIVGKAGAGAYDVEIHDNTFKRIRDNAIEPEKFAENWLIHGNTIVDAHGWFSFDGVLGGWRHVVANVGTFTSAPGRDFQDNRGGKIFKFDDEESAGDARKTSIVAHNSWNTRSYLAKRSVVEGLVHRNNLIVFCQGAKADVCPDRKTLTRDFITDDWPPSVSFDWDETSASFGEEFPAPNEENGRAGSTVRFKDPADGDFGPVGRPLTAPAVTFRALKDWPSAEDWSVGGGHDVQVGAVATDGGRYAPPPFHDSENVADPPRIVRVERGPRLVRIWLSRPIPPFAPMEIEASDRDGNVHRATLSIAGRQLVVGLGVTAPGDLTFALPLGGTPPIVSAWACPDPGIRIVRPQRDATC